MTTPVEEETQPLTPLQEMIVAALEDRAADVGTHFEQAVLEKIEEAVDERRAFVAATMFMPDLQEDEETDEVEEEEQIEEAKKKADKTGDEAGNGSED